MKLFKTKIIHMALILSSISSAIAPSFARADLDYISPYTRGDDRNIHLEEAPLPKGIESWLAEKLAAGVVGAAGAQIFNELEKGLGLEDKQSKILDLLNQVMGRLTEIQNTLSKIETEIKVSRYETGMRPIATAWEDFSTQLKYILNQNKQALANMKDGKVIDAEAAKRIAANIKGSEDKILATGEALINAIHANFTPSTDLEPLQKVFAQIQRDNNPVIDVEYFKNINDQLEKYRSYQILALALMVDIKRNRNEPEMVKSYLEVLLPNIQSETIIYPDNAFFSLPKTMKRVMNGEALYDRPQNLIWNHDLINYTTAGQFWNYADKRAPGQPMPPMKEMVQGLLNSKGLPLASFAQNAKKLGFSAGAIDPQKMIVLWAWVDCERGGINCSDFYIWFGNDQDPRQFVYQDNDYYFDRVRRDKNMPLDSFKSLGVIPVGELKE
ncbi:hypothetical protein DOM22_07305 [Bdellovibrio sp. ZAP7]|uniref:hypothetical protein n=1 Tax=Bdellovibrio sp. ZAP7 TaxID=2231053 RepID=UPI00115765BA|nr:hypothetical protein [Bdellovibrio sp. ZAP7]QDK44984.1 hypothetical protein DOM22_07305 [Bdellovibrio sp. ZAP7]